MNIDYRLDLYNAIDKFKEEMNEDDAMLIICHNSKQGDLVMGLLGDVDLLSGVLSNAHGHINYESEEHKINYEQTRSFVLNIALNIINSDEAIFKKFLIAMDFIKNNPHNANHNI